MGSGGVFEELANNDVNGFDTYVILNDESLFGGRVLGKKSGLFKDSADPAHSPKKFPDFVKVWHRALNFFIFKKNVKLKN